VKSNRLFLILVSVTAVLFAACGGGGGGGSAEVVQLDDVGAYFSSAGVNWNDYVKNDQASIYTASDTAATGTETGSYIDAVIHGGEMRAISLSALSTCPGMGATDALGAFDWACVQIGGNVQMVSTGLKDGKYLSDLIDFGTAQWKDNSVTVTSGGSTYGQSTSSMWWNNPIFEKTTAGVIATEGAVYIVTAATLELFTIAASKVALVVEPGVTISGPGSSSSAVYAIGRDFLWIEGAVDVPSDNIGIQFVNAQFGVIRGAQVEHGLSTGISLNSSYGCLLTDINVRDNRYGLSLASTQMIRVNNVSAFGNEEGVRVLSGSSDITLTNVASANNESYGFRISGGSNHLFSNIKAYNNGVYGMWLNGCTDSVISNVLLANNESNGLQVSGAHSNVIMNVTSVNNGNEGFRFITTENNTLANVTAANNNYTGIRLGESNNFLLANVSITDNEGWGLILDHSSDNNFTGLLKLGINALGNCAIAGTNPGLAHLTCLNADSSDAVLSTSVTSVDSFVAKVTSDDSANISDTNGSAQFNSISDWTGFENVFRTWGRDGAAFASTTNQGYADSTETLRIWDWSLESSGDTGDDGGPVLLDALTPPSGDNTLSHAWAGTSTVTTFLRNAQEILDDNDGNDNLLCETGEDCQYMPNIGGYQGHGSLISAGSFTAGAITGVTLVEYTNNGR
jgi:hypothetical protein